VLWVLAAFAPAQSGVEPPAQPQTKAAPRLQIYGMAVASLIYDFDQLDPDWFDVERPSKLPAFANQFGADGNFWASVRQSRLGVRSWLPTGLGEIRTEFEFDLLGVGEDAGQTTFHLRHAWGELGAFLAGQTYSVLMDPDVFPSALELWGPNGMVYYRNVQLRWTPIRGDRRLAFALERPGAKGDSGELAGRVELQNIVDRFPYPDFTAQYCHEGPWGHVQLSGIVRYIGWADTLNDAFDLSGHSVGWGVNLGSVIQLSKTSALRLEATYGRGIATYMRDAPTDVGAQTNFGDPSRPVVGNPLPLFGMVAFYDFRWSGRLRSILGYSRLDVENSDGQKPNAFRGGQYALADVLFYPVKDVQTGLEFEWGRRKNFRDGLNVNDFRLQFSAKYNFSIEVEKSR
jgi:DcaP outer membrane protein